jgi:thiamine biosynthesis lipoprotein ApbE
MEADALSTAFFVMGLAGARQFCAAHPQIGAVLVDRDPKRAGRARVHVLGNPDLEVKV